MHENSRWHGTIRIEEEDTMPVSDGTRRDTIGGRNACYPTEKLIENKPKAKEAHVIRKNY